MSSNLNEFLNSGSVGVTHRLKAKGYLRDIPLTQKTYRIPTEIVQWLDANVEGNMNFCVVKMLENQVKQAKESLTLGEVDVCDLT